MVFHTMGEQHMDFRVHNTTWEPVDFDGLKTHAQAVAVCKRAFTDYGS